MIDGAGIPNEGDWMPCSAYYNYLPCRGQRVTESCTPLHVTDNRDWQGGPSTPETKQPQWLVITVCLRCGHRRETLSEVFVEP